MSEMMKYRLYGFADTMKVNDPDGAYGLMIRIHDKEHQKILPLASTVECTVILEIPVVREPVKIEITRKQLHDALFKRCLTDNKQFQAIAEDLGL